MTAPSVIERPCPAVEPSRVLVLTDDEQRIIIDALAKFAPSRAELGDRHLVDRLHQRFRHGDAYANAIDELARVTLRKRRLEGEVRRCNIAIERAEEQALEDLAELGVDGAKHKGTGASLSITRTIRARLDVDTTGMPKSEADAERAHAKAAAAVALEQAGLGDYVKPDFNLNTVSAHFRQIVNDHVAAQLELPEHERQPRPAGEFLPVELRGHLVLDDKPTISVRAN